MWNTSSNKNERGLQFANLQLACKDAFLEKRAFFFNFQMKHVQVYNFTKSQRV